MDEHAHTEQCDPIRLVVIDDHELVLQSVIRMLDGERDLAVVASAGNVTAGLQAVREHLPDIVVVDYQLPDGDGPGAARAIRAAWPQIRVILLTGSGGGAAAFEAERAGCVGYVEKTGAVTDLIDTIRRVSAGDYGGLDDHTHRLPQPTDLVVHYQPIVDLGTEAVAGYEALVRWQHPRLGLVPPADFIALAEQTTLIVDIGERVRHDACHQAAAWAEGHHADPARFISINLSGRELVLPDLTARVRRVLEETGLAPHLLVVEVTESFFIADSDEHTRKLSDLKDLGVRIALDDFGTGYSSLAYLRRFPIDIIKLDKSFTDELPHGARGLRLVGAMGQLASDMGAVTEAEGIETAEQAACLLSLGWELGQGYYYGRPADPLSFAT